MKYYVGIDIGGTTIKHGLVDETGKIIEKGSLQTPTEHDDFIKQLAILTQKYMGEQIISGVGISSPGIVQRDGFLLTSGAIDCLEGVNLAEELNQAVGIKVVVENDANAAAIAEHWLGNAKNVHDYLCIVLGTGLGGGIVINDQIYRGGHGMAGEFGWMVTKEIAFSEDLEEKSLNMTSAIVGGLCKKYSLAKQRIDPAYPTIKDARIIFSAAHAGERLAKMILNQFYYDLGTGILNLIAAFDPELILIGGGISANQEFNESLAEVITDLELRHHSISKIRDVAVAPVKPARLKNDAGIIGAVYQVINRR